MASQQVSPSGPNADERMMLNIRVEALVSNLGKLQNFLQTVPHRIDNLDRLSKELEDARKSLLEMDKGLHNALVELLYPKEEATREGRDFPYDSALESLVRGREKLKHLSDITLRMNEMVKGMRAKSFRVMDKHEEVRGRLNADLRQRTDPCIAKLEDLKAKLAGVCSIAELWRLYSEEASQPSQEIFGEYVDFLGGLALRDTGFDAGTSQLAEDLILGYKTKEGPLHVMMALPARQSAVARTLARIIRVGFPEWTIWALPFVAHEFWHVVAREDLDGELRREIGRQLGTQPIAKIEERFQICLADAFAAFTVGPAYAYSVFLLLLNPRQAFSCEESGQGKQAAAEALLTDLQLEPNDERIQKVLAALNPNPKEQIGGAVCDDMRASAILEMLRLMQKKGPKDDPPYRDVIKCLSDMWGSAVLSVTGVSSTPQAESDREQIKVFVTALWLLLDRIQCAPFLISQWNAIKDWHEHLLKGDSDNIVPPITLELRHVLNAIWKARVDPNRDVDINSLTQVAERLRVRKPLKQDSSGGMSAQSPNVPRGVIR